MTYEYMHFTATRPTDITDKMNYLARSGWKPLAVTLASPYDAMIEYEFTVFLERERELSTEETTARTGERVGW